MGHSSSKPTAVAPASPTQPAPYAGPFNYLVIDMSGSQHRVPVHPDDLISWSELKRALKVAPEDTLVLELCGSPFADKVGPLDSERDSIYRLQPAMADVHLGYQELHRSLFLQGNVYSKAGEKGGDSSLIDLKIGAPKSLQTTTDRSTVFYVLSFPLAATPPLADVR
ncbi:hypothetical protein JCM6882_005534 [Rhodosporidiobolus microsporus]